MTPHRGYRESELHKDPGTYPSRKSSTRNDSPRSSLMYTHQGAQFCDDPTELPQGIVLDEDDADTGIAGGFEFTEALRRQPCNEIEWMIELRKRSSPEGSMAVESSQGSRTVFPEEEVETQRKSDAPHKGEKTTTSFDLERRPTDQLVSVPAHEQTPVSLNTAIDKVKAFLKNVPLGISFIVIVPATVGVAVGFGTKSLVSGAVVGGSFLAAFTAVFAYAHVMWKEGRAGDSEKCRPREEEPGYEP